MSQFLRRTGTNCIKVGLPGKRILSKRKGLRKSPILLITVSENRFSGKTYFIQLPPASFRLPCRSEVIRHKGQDATLRAGKRVMSCDSADAEDIFDAIGTKKEQVRQCSGFCTALQLICKPTRTENQLYKNPNIAQLVPFRHSRLCQSSADRRPHRGRPHPGRGFRRRRI